jgi:hypothetical protein
MTATNEQEDHGRSQAKAQLESIQEMVKNLNHGPESDREEALQTIHDDALEVTIREGWKPPGGEPYGGVTYKILLCTGGPAVQIVGDLDEWSQPESARLEYQDWYTPWQQYQTSDDEEQDLIFYAATFYFGE